MNQWNQLASEEAITKTITSLASNGITAEVFDNPTDLKLALKKLLPEGSEVMTMTSQTLEGLGINQDINESGRYQAIRPKLYAVNQDPIVALGLKRQANVPEFVIGSIHAVTEDGKVVIASNTGSQLGAYVYGAQHVIWVVGTQKIVPNLDAAMSRLNDYVLLLESERAQKAYGVQSNISKLLIINKEITPGRIHILFLKQSVGF
jgi:hypothetical protein